MSESLFGKEEAAARPGLAHPPATAMDTAVRSAMRFLLVVAAVLALAWTASGLRQVEPGTQAVVLRLGAVDRVAQAGLLLAWPRPFEEVVVLPARERQHTLEVTRLDLREGEREATPPGVKPPPFDARKDGGYVLTGDAGVAHLKASVTWQVTDPRAYLLARERLPAALERATAAAVIRACAGRGLDGVMVAGLTGGDGSGRDERLAASRERLRGDVLALLNQRLAGLGMGVEAGRVDLVASLPARARPAFEAVVAAEAAAARDVAEARTAATRAEQEADNERVRVLSAAQAKAQEIVAVARVATGRITALTDERDPERRAQLLRRLHRERLDTILKVLANAGGTVMAVDGREPVKLYLQGR